MGTALADAKGPIEDSQLSNTAPSDHTADAEQLAQLRLEEKALLRKVRPTNRGCGSMPNGRR